MTIDSTTPAPPIFRLLPNSLDEKKSPIIKLVTYMDWRTFSSLTMTCKTLRGLREFKDLKWNRLYISQIVERVSKNIFWHGTRLYHDDRRTFLEMLAISDSLLQDAINKPSLHIDKRFQGKPYLLGFLMKTKCSGKSLLYDVNETPTQLLGQTLPLCDLRGNERYQHEVGKVLGWAACTGDVDFLKLFLEKFPADYYMEVAFWEQILGCERDEDCKKKWPNTSEKARSEVVKYFFNYANEYGETLIFLAAKNGRAEVIKYLASFDVVRINKNNYSNESPFYIACKNGHANVLKVFHQLGRYVDTYYDDHQGNTPFNVAVNNGHAEALDVLVNIYEIWPRFSIWGPHFVIHACETGHVDVVKVLNEKGFLPVNKLSQGETALTVTAKNGHYELMEYLLSYVPKNTKINYDFIGQTPAQIAVKRSDYRLLKLLIEKCPQLLNQKGYRTTPFYLACENGNLKAMKLLLEYDQLNINEGINNSPLHIIKDLEAANMLFHDPRINLFIKDLNNEYAYQKCAEVAVSHGDIQFLTEIRNTEKVELDDNKLIARSLKKEKIQVFHHLISRGSFDTNAVFSQLDTSKIVTLESVAPLLTILVQQTGFDLNGKDKKGELLQRQLMFYAACYDNLQLMKLVSVGSNPLVTLGCGCALGGLSIIKYMIEERKIDYNYPLDEMGTPLHLTCSMIENLRIEKEINNELQPLYDKLIVSLKYLLSLPNINVELTNANGNKPIEMTSSQEVQDLFGAPSKQVSELN